MELQGDQLALARVEGVERGAHGQPPQRLVGSLRLSVGRRIDRVVRQAGNPPAAAQFVERGVARDAEQPRPRATALGPKGAPLPVGTLERQRRHLLGRAQSRSSPAA